MSGAMLFPDSYCRKCASKNGTVFLAPVFVAGIDARDGSHHPVGIGTHICLECAESRDWIDTRTGNVRADTTL